MPDPPPSWAEGQVAALALIASSIVGDVLPNPFAAFLSGRPLLSAIALMVAFPLVVMVPVLLVASARVGWRARSLWAGARLGLAVSFLTTVIVLLAYVVGLALGQPQMLKIGLSWESLRDAALVLVTTTVTGTVLSGVGAFGGAAGRSFFEPGPRDDA